MYKILICDDDHDISEALRIYLSADNYEISEAHTGSEAVKLVMQENIDLVLMDIMMPQMDGISATAKIRESSNIPIIMITAKSESQDKILGLDIGADDYITKPFVPAEVLARVRSQLRRYTRLGSEVKRDDVLSVGGIELDDRAKAVLVDGAPVNLTPIEFEILKLFMQNPGKVFSTSEIYSLVWKEAPLGAEGTVAVHVRHIREKIEINPSDPRYIKVVWGKGYKMELSR